MAPFADARCSSPAAAASRGGGATPFLQRCCGVGLVLFFAGSLVLIPRILEAVDSIKEDGLIIYEDKTEDTWAERLVPGLKELTEGIENRKVNPVVKGLLQAHHPWEKVGLGSWLCGFASMAAAITLSSIVFCCSSVKWVVVGACYPACRRAVRLTGGSKAKPS
eukprot:SAG22_NODE_1548_length_4150_cov_2.816095_3_plen_164_part_00